MSTQALHHHHFSFLCLSPIVLFLCCFSKQIQENEQLFNFIQTHNQALKIFFLHWRRHRCYWILYFRFDWYVLQAILFLCKPSFSSASHPLQRSRILWNMYASMNVLSCSSMYIYKPPFHIFLSRCCISMNCVFKMLNLSCSLNIVVDPPVDAVQSTWTTIYVSVIKLHLPHQEWNALG